MLNKAIFLESEADAWFDRNKNSINEDNFNKMFKSLEDLKIHPRKILEIGCSDGKRSAFLNQKFNAECWGIDPSQKAIQWAKKIHPNCHFIQGTADSLNFENESFDLIILSFCLYLCDPQDYFKIASEVNKVLSKNGHLMIIDFCVPSGYINAYKHKDTVKVYKFPWTNMFCWHPHYALLSRTYFDHIDNASYHDLDERCSIDIIYKGDIGYFPSTKI